MLRMLRHNWNKYGSKRVFLKIIKMRDLQRSPWNWGWLQRKLGPLVFYKILEATETHHIAIKILHPPTPWSLYGTEVSIWQQPLSCGRSPFHLHGCHVSLSVRAPGRVWNRLAAPAAFNFLKKSLSTLLMPFLKTCSLKIFLFVYNIISPWNRY